MSWYNRRPKGYKYIRGEEVATSVQPVSAFDTSRREPAPSVTASAAPNGGHEATFHIQSDAANFAAPSAKVS